MRRERMSRPSSSVPHQWAAEGEDKRFGRTMKAGSWGAIQGAKRAKATKIRTNTTPVVASGLWRATRWNEMAVVDKVKSRQTPKVAKRGWPSFVSSAAI